MARYAANTEVSSTKSRDEIERTLTRYGADQFMYGWQEDGVLIAFRMNARQIKFILPMPSRGERQFTHHAQGPRTAAAAANQYEQATRQRWRALLLIIKAKLEAIESGISIFEDEFLANVLLPDGATVGEWMRPQVEQVYRLGTMPPMLPMLPAPGEEA
jgi:hypothetical protein